MDDRVMPVPLAERIAGLTERQREILSMIGAGLTTAEIAERLHRTAKTVESHRMVLGKRLGARNRVELALMAVEAGLAGVDRAGPGGQMVEGEVLRRAISAVDVSGEQVLRRIDAATAAVTGEAFLQALVEHVGRAFDAVGAYVARLDADGVLRVIAGWAPEGWPRDLSYAFAGSPCEFMERATIRRIPSSLQALFPSIVAYRDLGAEGLMITPLCDSSGGRIGTLAVLHGGDPPDESRCPELILRIFGARAAAELERLRREEELRASEARYRLLAENTSDIVSLISPELKYIYVSPSCRALLGFRPQEMLGRSVFDFFHPDDGPVISKTCLSLMHGCDRASVDLRRLRFDGSYRWFQSNVYAHHDEVTGEVDWIISSSRDVHDRKMAEEDLRRRERELRRAQAVAKVGSWMIDIASGALTWSEETYRIFGMDHGTPVTLDLFLARVHPDDRDAVMAAWTAALRGHPYDLVHRILADGEVRWVRERAEVTFGPDGTAVSGLGTVEDITSQKHHGMELRRKQLMLAYAELIAEIGTWQVDVPDRTLHASEGLCRLLGVPRETFPASVDVIINKVVLPEDRAALCAALERSIETGERFEARGRVRLPDGSVRTLRGQGIAVHDDAGRVSHVIGLNRPEPA
ncbi:MAG: PAS domain-containing protein [Phycisphaeraceae bacterium]|nr:PAS domain-containing protein [Phycisphaeraceae bacterium]